MTTNPRTLPTAADHYSTHHSATLP